MEEIEEAARRGTKAVMCNEDCPQEFCDEVRACWDDIIFGDFKLEWLRRNLNHEEI